MLFLRSVSNSLDQVPDFANKSVPGTIVGNMTIYDKLQIINQHKIEYVNYNPVAITVIIVTVTIMILSIFILWVVINETKHSNNTKLMFITSVQKLDNVYINYFLCYIIPFLSFNYSSIFDMIALGFLLSLTGAVYINSDLLYVNVFFSIRGYNIFKVVNEDNIEYVVLSKEKQLYLHKTIEVKDVSASTERFVLDVR